MTAINIEKMVKEGWKPATCNMAYHPARGMAQLTGDEYEALKAGIKARQDARCAKGKHSSEGQEIRKVLWKPGDDGLKYKWNKVGEVKCYEFTCGNCGQNQEFMNL